jgi:class 3 adenylate cyclase/outer membrane protein OmpA-like peptidoglycan-associated protein
LLVPSEAQERVERRLAAILAADVVGYSRLMGRDEEGTHAALKEIRRELIDPKLQEHRGRIVKTTGDGLLVEFASVVDAVRCAVAVQNDLAQRNTRVPAERRMEFRIGINLGDIIIDQDDIFGDGVNVAARLEPLAAPGGICISQVVRDQVRDKLDFVFEDMGDHQVKNIARPVRVYRVAIAEAQDPSPKTRASAQSRKESFAREYYVRLKRRLDLFSLRGLAIVICAALAAVVLPKSLQWSFPSLLDNPEQLAPARVSKQTLTESADISLPTTEYHVAPPAPPPSPERGQSVAAAQPAHSILIGDAVLFEKDQVVLSRSALLTIGQEAAFLQDNPRITVTIEGHCSEDEGAREGPSVLAQLRANQVRHALNKAGIADSRIRTVSYGNTRPAVSGESETAREQNRRAIVLRN